MLTLGNQFCSPRCSILSITGTYPFIYRTLNSEHRNYVHNSENFLIFVSDHPALFET